MVTHMSQDFQAQAAASQRSAGRLFRVHKMFPPHLLLNWTPIWDLKFTPIWDRFPISTFPPLIVETEKEQMQRKLKDRAEEHFNRSGHFFPTKSFKWCNLSIDTLGFKSWPVSRRQMRQMTKIKLFLSPTLTGRRTEHVWGGGGRNTTKNLRKYTNWHFTVELDFDTILSTPAQKAKF